MKKLLIKIFLVFLSLYLFFCLFFYFTQEYHIFYPIKLDKDYVFRFEQDFEEIYFEAKDKKLQNGILFKADSTKGLVFYLHGNAGALNTWGKLAHFYTDQGYDFFIIDYRGFGKSQGDIHNQGQLLDDIQLAYNEMKKRYDENNIIIQGFSIGTGPASYLASTNQPHMLILQAPYYSLKDVIHEACPIIPTFLIKFKLETYKYVENCSIPVIIFHGDKDMVINVDNSVRLGNKLKENDELIIIKGEEHNGIIDNKEYLDKLEILLAN